VAWPTEDEIEDGYAGGYGPGSGVAGTIEDCIRSACVNDLPLGLDLLVDGNDLTVSWEAPTDDEGYTYVVQRNVDTTGWYTVYKGPALSYLDLSLSPGSYGYRVMTLNDICQESDWDTLPDEVII